MAERKTRKDRNLDKASWISAARKALIEKGWIKVQRFRNCRNKSAYIYQLTPTGIGEKVRVTRRFLARKLEEHAGITKEIERLKQEVRRNDLAETDG